MEERPFRIREVEGSNPSVSTFFLGVWVEVARHCLSVAQLVEHVTVDVCDHRVAGSIPAAESLFYSICNVQAKLGSAGNRTLDLSHPERESCH